MKNQYLSYNRAILLVFLILISFDCFAQIKAVTENGDEVFLFEDHSWAYANPENIDTIELKTNPTVFKVSDHSTFQVKSNNTDIGIFIDSKNWQFNKAIINKEAEYEFRLKEEDLYGMIITEKIEIPLEQLADLAITNMQAAISNFVLVNKEYRMVNGMKVIHIEMKGTTQGIKVAYLGYYFSNANGSNQFLTYTSQNLLELHRENSEILLNGLVLKTPK